MKTGRSSRRGFTLVEIITVSTLFSFVAIGVAGFLYLNVDAYYTNMARLRVNSDIRGFTSAMTEEARNADGFVIYPSYLSNAATDRVTDGGAGDMLVLEYRDNTGALIRRIGYYRNPGEDSDGNGIVDAEENETGPVRRFEQSGAALASLPAAGDRGTHPIVWELARGLAAGDLFYNFYGRSVMVRGEIKHEGSLRVRRSAAASFQGQRYVTNTYNFTVSPRS